MNKRQDRVIRARDRLSQQRRGYGLFGGLAKMSALEEAGGYRDGVQIFLNSFGFLFLCGRCAIVSTNTGAVVPPGGPLMRRRSLMTSPRVQRSGRPTLTKTGCKLDEAHGGGRLMCTDSFSNDFYVSRIIQMTTWSSLSPSSEARSFLVPAVDSY